MALVDAGLGLGAKEICENICKEGFDPNDLGRVIITHAHLGHWGGAPYFRDEYASQVWVSALGAERLIELKDPGLPIAMKFNRYPPDFKPRACPVDRTMADGNRIPVGSLELQAILVQGHSKDSMCFLLVENGKRALFSGDTVFYGGRIGLVNLEGYSFEDYRRDIHKLADLNIDMLFPGHGVFVLSRGQKHVYRAIHQLSDFVLPDSFFESNEFVWQKEYLSLLTQDVGEN